MRTCVLLQSNSVSPYAPVTQSKGDDMPVVPDVSTVSAYVLDALRETPTQASTRYTLAEGIIDRHPGVTRDSAREIVAQTLTQLQDAGDVAILPAEVWDMSGDDRVKLQRR